MKKSIIFIGAHQDDILPVVGTLILLRNQGYQIHEFCLTRGEKGGDGPDTAEIRTKEEEQVCEILGAKLKFFSEPDGAVYAHQAICQEVSDAIKEIDPIAVFTLWALEKPDHAATCNIAMKALYLANMMWTCEFYMCQIDPGYNFRPDFYVNISKVMDEVIKIGECYPSQSPEYPKNCTRRRYELGKQLWVEAAESFTSNFPSINQRWDRPCEVGRLLRSL